MRHKIQKNMLLIILVSILLTSLLVISVSYVQTSRQMKEGLRQEAGYLKTGIEEVGMEVLDYIGETPGETRITLITGTGEVLYDSGYDKQKLENHLERREVREAIESGMGEQVRKSTTTGQKMYYYAIRMENGNILRVSKTTDAFWDNAIVVVPYMVIMSLFMILLAFLLAKWQTERLIRPINMLNLEKPMENEIYEELTPLLVRIEEQNRQKDEAERMRKEFSANVSHELRTPLTSISGYAEIMKSGLVKPEDMVGFSEKIYKEASRLIGLIEDIIKLSKLDEGSVSLEKEEVDLYEMAQDICARLANRAEKERVNINIIGDHICYRGIRRILDEMVYNICENAIKYNKEGGEVEVWVTGTSKGPMVSVSDTGIGIPPEEKERIFERFYRIDKSHSKETGGTGLGLSIVKHGALLHKAKIEVESTVGIGTRMDIIFVD